VNITPGVRKIVQDSRIKEGLCLVNAMHITASVFINDNESGLHGDFDIWPEKLAPDHEHRNEAILVQVNFAEALELKRR
jgi:thiamine phosphate synthase YjbQ (UPF0047 family)